MKTIAARLSILVVTLAIAASAFAQESTNTYRGFNEYENIRALITSSGSLVGLDSSVGYDFNQHFGVFGGVPMYFTTSGGFGSGTADLHAAGMGDAYVGAEFFAYGKALKYSSTVTVGLPTGNVEKGFSPGEATIYWTNRFRHSFGRLTPVFSVGVGNSMGIAIGAPSSQPITRALTSTDTIANLQEGAEFDFSRRVYAGGSAYQVYPFNERADATLSKTQLRENGVDTWLGFEPSRVVRLEVGYSRSTTFGLNSLSLHMGFNVGRVLRSLRSAGGPAKPVRG